MLVLRARLHAEKVLCTTIFSRNKFKGNKLVRHVMAAALMMSGMQGVGGSAVGGLRAKSGELNSIDLSSHQFYKIKCLFTDSDALDHTLYSFGILCGDILSRSTVILDYARSRIMFVPKDTSQ